MNGSYSITSKGQVTLPKELREAVGLTTEHKVSFSQRGGDIVIHKEPTLEEVAAKLQQKYRKSGVRPVSQADYDAARGRFDAQGGTW